MESDEEWREDEQRDQSSGDSKNNGIVEGAIQSVHGMIRKYAVRLRKSGR